MSKLNYVVAVLYKVTVNSKVGTNESAPRNFLLFQALLLFPFMVPVLLIKIAKKLNVDFPFPYITIPAMVIAILFFLYKYLKKIYNDSRVVEISKSYGDTITKLKAWLVVIFLMSSEWLLIMIFVYALIHIDQ